MDDPPLAAVHAALVSDGVGAVFFANQRELLDTELDLEIDGDVSGTLWVGDQRCELADVQSVYIRCYDSRQLPVIAGAGEGTATWQHAVELDGALISWLELTPAFVVNRPSAMGSNNSKPFQASLIRPCGFSIPDTLITTDPQAARDFWERHGSVIYKSISGVRSIVSQVDASHADRFADVAWCPTQFQQYVPGNDWRVHIVGDEVFACEIISTADDYRYAVRQGAEVDIQPRDLPSALNDRCRLLAHALDLPVVGIDLRCTPEGEWYCFEANPSPGFTYYESATGQPIAAAIARLLVSGRT
jgi:hypothetical protein